MSTFRILQITPCNVPLWARFKCEDSTGYAPVVCMALCEEPNNPDTFVEPMIIGADGVLSVCDCNFEGMVGKLPESAVSADHGLWWDVFTT